MGRWSQRRRAGGGGTGFLPATCTTIDFAHIRGPGNVVIGTSAPVDASLLDLTDFTDQTSGAHPSSFTQHDVDNISLEGWPGGDDPVDGENLIYNGHDQGLCSPQVVLMINEP